MPLPRAITSPAALPPRDRVVLVTGGAQGIGRGVAQAIPGAGDPVAIVDASGAFDGALFPVNGEVAAASRLQAYAPLAGWRRQYLTATPHRDTVRVCTARRALHLHCAPASARNPHGAQGHRL